MRKTVIIILVSCITIAPLFTVEVGAIIIDPGHGGRDRGAVGTHIINGETVTLVEKEITLGIAKMLKEKLRERYPNIQVVLTREDDVSIALEERVNQANAVQLGTNEIALFVSIHTNASVIRAGTDNRGYDFHIDSNADRYTENFAFAEKIGMEFGKVFGNEVPNRGIMQERFHILRNTRMPAVMLNMGFITSLEDAILLYSEQGLEKCSTALLNGITAYIGSL
jgi:N-acetylmuramoyl-L-alanine amidase